MSRTVKGKPVSSAVQAVALDYDGTLTETDVPEPEALEAVRETRRRGQAVVLVTGRILSELRAVFPAVEGEFDAIVAENGAVLADGDGIRDLATPVDPALGQALTHRDIPVRQGRVLLACDTEHLGAVFEEIARLGLDCQVVRNRAAMMVLPGGVTKGTGLQQALGNLGISRHSTLAVGDAENDHALLEACELGVAVANAVDALKRRADLVLPMADGAGVAALLRGPVVGGSETVRPRMRRLTLGRDIEGNPVRVPASQINLLLTGASGSGKSYLAGLLVEQLVRMSYSVLVVDLEGDHQGLADRRGILGVGGEEPLPSAGHLTALLRHRFGSVVLDLSRRDPHQQQAYLSAIAPALLAQRAVTGLPHWIFFEEAQSLPLGLGLWGDALRAGERGFCFSTFRPDRLPEVVARAVDCVVLTEGRGAGWEEVLPYVARVSGLTQDRIATRGERGGAMLVDASGTEPPTPFVVGRRSSGHVRHWHKYIDGELPEPLRFYFAAADLGQVAGNLREFHRKLVACQPATIEEHARRHDFSRWIGEVLKDRELTQIVAHAERRLRTGEHSADALRDAVQLAIEARYLE
jgi:hydroxymethylpyrimidine pyrophosphatase-like HAD family hydrolase